jgi:hypothetical protein
MVGNQFPHPGGWIMMATDIHPRLTRNRSRVVIGITLLLIGLAGHLAAANVEGGRALHYQHHIFGFFLLAIVSLLVVGALSRFFWRGRHDVTVVIVGALQAIFGCVIYVIFSTR